MIVYDSLWQFMIKGYVLPIIDVVNGSYTQ
jgi:hypothetical protein